MTNDFQWSADEIRQSWLWSEDQLQAWQLERLNAQFETILPINRFYQAKLGTRALQLATLDALADLPFTTKQDLVDSAVADPHSVSGHHTFPRSSYSRLHRTSGTTGEPLMVMDTADDWRRWSATWQHVLEAAGITQQDRVFLAFSFGPFIGFWSAHQACIDRGATVIPGGGLSSLARLEFMRQSQATVVFCTPSYALHLAELAKDEGFPLAELPVRRIVVAGEAGGSLQAVRQRIEQAWAAQVIDHSGATEIGPWGLGWPERAGLQVIETSFIAELIPFKQNAGRESKLAGNGAGDGEEMELVLTSLFRLGAPVIRYRTGDAVRAQRPTEGPCRFLRLPDGVLGRVDDMVTIRGVNVYPSSVEAIAREFAGIAEFRVLVTRSGQLDQLHIEVESDAGTRVEFEKTLSVRLGLRIPVQNVEPESLPRSELKSRRWLDQRNCDSFRDDDSKLSS